jgi:hypothetical protein
MTAWKVPWKWLRSVMRGLGVGEPPSPVAFVSRLRMNMLSWMG